MTSSHLAGQPAVRSRLTLIFLGLLMVVVGNVVAVAADNPRTYQPVTDRVVDPSTLYGKVVFGYQGWFSTADDGSPMKVWNHWCIKKSAPPTPANIRPQMWPDMSEYDADELYDTDLKYPDGTPAKIYSAWNTKTVMRHFKWMQDYNLDGALAYRFISRFNDQPEIRTFYNKVLDNMRQGAEKYGRVFGVQYDISDYTGPNVVKVIQDDWMNLVDDLKIVTSPRYLHHKDKPLVVLRNFGNSGGTRLITPSEAIELITWFQTKAPKKYQATVMGALPGRWRTMGKDVKPDPEWAKAFRKFDVVSSWPVGRFRDEKGSDEWLREVIIPDMEECAKLKIDYIPAVYSGYSYSNADAEKKFNSTPRNGGHFYWHQIHNIVNANAGMIYNSIFDEIDESTAMFKVAPNAASVPLLNGKRKFLPLDVDGETLPSDWYLKLSDYAGRMLRKEIPLTEERPIKP